MVDGQALSARGMAIAIASFVKALVSIDQNYLPIDLAPDEVAWFRPIALVAKQSGDYPNPLNPQYHPTHPMALVACPECNGKVSTEAPSCPHCGAPRGRTALDTSAIGTSVSTIQSTSKRLKKHVLFSAFAFFGGGFCLARGINNQQHILSALGFLAMVLGLVWYIVTKLRTWWHHG